MSFDKESFIKAIDGDIVHKICSGQVIVNLALAVKELVENSLDAGAKNIEIRLKDYGRELVEVVDDGFGVEEHNFTALTLKHHTSKLELFSGLSDLSTFGFRGEALSSLCAVSNVCIITRHKDASTGSRLEFDSSGLLVIQTLCARPVGTTVSLRNLFVNLPVRHKDFVQNLKREFGKMINLLTAYSLISSNVRFLCTNHLQQGKKTVLSTLGLPSIKENIACIFGAKQLPSLKEFVPTTKLSPEILEEFRLSDSVLPENFDFQIEGFVSSCQHGKGRSSTDRQFFYINNRPCELPKVSKLINSSYHFYNRHQSPFVLLNVSTKKDAIDINVTPDKRKILVHNEGLLLAIIKNSLHTMFDAIAPMISSCSTNSESILEHFQKQTPKSSSQPILCSGNAKRFLDAPESSDEKKLKEFYQRIVSQPCSVSQRSSCVSPSHPVDERVSEFVEKLDVPKVTHNREPFTVLRPYARPEGKSPNRALELSPKESSPKTPLEKLLRFQRKSSPCDPPLPAKRKEKEVSITKFLISKRQTLSEDLPSASSSQTDDECVLVEKIEHEGGKVPVDDPVISGSKGCCILNQACPEEPVQCVSPSFSVMVEEEKNDLTEDSSKQSDCVVLDDNVVSIEKHTVQVEFSLEALRRRRKDREVMKEEVATYQRFRAKISPFDSQTAEQELQRELSKDMFQEMEILGQFNLGFVVTKLGSQLFIVDQHASDEKYNFEMLQKNTVMQTQKLVVPQRLELTSVNEMVVLDNLEVFARNGFELEVEKDAEVGRRLKLIAVPMSRNWVFGKDDIEEMIFMLSDSPGEKCRPSKMQKMFASRACRQSVMVGQALTSADMKKLLVHMGEIEQPWNCPHGRPTIRHLFNLDLLKLAEEKL